jgi:hypothetical protein
MPAEWAFTAKLQRKRALHRAAFPADFKSSPGDEFSYLEKNCPARFRRIDSLPMV